MILHRLCLEWQLKQFRIQVNTALSTNQPTDISIQNQFKIYPNPAKDKIQLVFDFPIEKRL